MGVLTQPVSSNECLLSAWHSLFKGLEIQSGVHTFNRYSLSTCCVPDTLLDGGVTGAWSLQWEEEQIKSNVNQWTISYISLMINVMEKKGGEVVEGVNKEGLTEVVNLSKDLNEVGEWAKGEHSRWTSRPWRGGSRRYRGMMERSASLARAGNRERRRTQGSTCGSFFRWDAMTTMYSSWNGESLEEFEWRSDTIGFIFQGDQPGSWQAQR